MAGGQTEGWMVGRQRDDSKWTGMKQRHWLLFCLHLLYVVSRKDDTGRESGRVLWVWLPLS